MTLIEIIKSIYLGHTIKIFLTAKKIFNIRLKFPRLGLEPRTDKQNILKHLQLLCLTILPIKLSRISKIFSLLNFINFYDLIIAN